MIYQITTYKDEQGRALEVQTPYDPYGPPNETWASSKLPELPPCKYIGSYVGQIGHQSFQANFEIPDCTTVEEAFKRYDERAKISAQEKAKEIQQQIIKQQLAMPAKMPLQMPGRNGKLIT